MSALQIIKCITTSTYFSLSTQDEISYDKAIFNLKSKDGIDNIRENIF